MKPKNKFEAHFGASIYLLGIISLIFFQLLFSSIYGAVSPVVGSSKDYILRYIAGIAFQLGYLAVFILYLKQKNTSPCIAVRFKINPVFYVAGVFGAVFCLLLFFPIAHVFDLFFDYVGLTPSDSFMVGGVIENVLLILGTVILAPICEELIYRAGLVSGLKLKLTNKFKGRFSEQKSAILCAVIGGIAFSLMHMSPRQTVYQFFLGYCAVMLALASNSVVPSILLHLFSNLIAILSGFFAFVDDGFNWYISVFSASTSLLVICSVLLSILGVCAFTILFSLLKRYNINSPLNQDNDTNQPLTQQTKAKRTGTYSIIILGIMVCVVMWIAQFVAQLKS